MKIFDYKILKNSIYSLIVFTFIAPILLKASDNDIEEILVVGSRINNENLKKILKKDKLTTRDSRVVERKKYGHRKARRSFQFSKR